MRLGPLKCSGSGSDGEDLAPLVVAARRADAVRHIGRGTLRAGAQLGQA
jgi:hypothetical protein